MTKASITAFVLTVFITISSNPIWAQRTDFGAVTISAGHGFLSPANMGFSTVFENLDVFTEININGVLSYQNLGPYYLKGEYALSEKSGIGLNMAFIGNKVKWTDVATSYTYDIFRNNVAIAIRYNYYFVKKQSFEFYGGIGLGVRVGGWGVKTSDLNFDLPNLPALIPLALESTLGIRAYVVKDLALYTEIGGSKGLAQLGLAYRI